MCDCGYIVIIMRYGTSMEGVSSQVAEKMVQGIAESLHQEAKSKAFLIWHIKCLIIILWPLTQ